VDCPLVPPASPELADAFMAAGCQWDEGSASGSPPGLLDLDESFNKTPGPDGGSSDSSGQRLSSSRTSAVPEPATWLILGLGMTVFVFARRKLALAPATACRGGAR
jgi:hypothetical protein